MKTQFDILRKIRELILRLTAGLTIEQLHTIPEGFNNNIAWNVVHLVVTQQLLHYRLSGNQTLVSDEWIDLYRKGTAPNKVMTQQEYDDAISLFKSLPDTLEEDYNNGKFSQYKEYPTSTGFVLDSIDTAIAFNTMHESLHLGVIMAMRKLV
jgi:hypothetical protein